MWVFTRPRGGQDYYLLMCEDMMGGVFCPIQRFDGFHKFPTFRPGTSLAWGKMTIVT